MSEDIYIVAITALFPLTAGLLVSQVNPYHALVIRGILGAVAALIYALFGAADVALTEALVGTMLSITLYAVAVRSSLSMRLGVLETEPNPEAEITAPMNPETGDINPGELLPTLSTILSKYHMRLERVTYPNLQALQAALEAKEIHTTSIQTTVVLPAVLPAVLSESDNIDETLPPQPGNEQPLYQIQTRVHRLYSILQAEISPSLASLSYQDLA